MSTISNPSHIYQLLTLSIFLIMNIAIPLISKFYEPTKEPSEYTFFFLNFIDTFNFQNNSNIEMLRVGFADKDLCIILHK